MRYSWPLFVVGVALLVWSRLGGEPALGIVGLILIAVAFWLRLRARPGLGRQDVPRPEGLDSDDDASGGAPLASP